MSWGGGKWDDSFLKEIALKRGYYGFVSLEPNRTLSNSPERVFYLCF